MHVIDKIRYPPCWPIRGALRVKFPDIGRASLAELFKIK